MVEGPGVAVQRTAAQPRVAIITVVFSEVQRMADLGGSWRILAAQRGPRNQANGGLNMAWRLSLATKYLDYLPRFRSDDNPTDW